MASKNMYFYAGLPYILLIPLPGSQIRTAALQAGQGKGFQSMLLRAVDPSHHSETVQNCEEDSL